jgi:DNA-binding transcriptional LysR family regulator
MLERTLASADAARQRAQEFTRKEVAPLKIGLAPSISPSLLLEPVAEIAKFVPGLHVQLREETAEKLVNLLLEGEINVAMVGEQVCTKQHLVLRFLSIDLLQHFAHVCRNRLLIQREKITQSRGPVAPGFDQLLLQQGNSRGIVVAQKPHDGVLVEHVSFYDFRSARARMLNPPRARSEPLPAGISDAT